MNKKNTYLVGIFSWFGYVLPFHHRIDLIKQAGFDSTTIWWEDEEGDSITANKNMPHIVRETGLYLENIHLPFNDSSSLWSESRSLREKAVKSHLNWVYDCAKYDIPMMVMHLTEGDHPPAPNSYGIDSMMKISQEAEEAGVQIALENTRRDDNVQFILSQIESPYLGMCYDTSHDWLNSKIKMEILKEYGTRLFATHLSDNDGLKDRHWLPGNGSIEWQKIGETFPNDTYEGCLTLEIYPRQDEFQLSPDKFLEKAYQRITWIHDLVSQK